MTSAGDGQRVLVLGGTAEARELAAALERSGVSVVFSLAGRVAEPRRPVNEVRIGGFGGREGLERWLIDEGIGAVVDATHPFASRITASASEACERIEVPLLRLERPGWAEQVGDRWHWVNDFNAAAAVAPRLGRRIFLTVGSRGVGAFAHVASSRFLVRCVEPTEGPLPPHHELLLDRGPYTVEGEVDVIRRHAIEVIVTRNSGGEATEAKLAAARVCGLPVVIVRRPRRSAAQTVDDVPAALDWVRGLMSHRSAAARH